MSTDPFRVLGLSTDASAAEVRNARRALAKEHHPDRGGEPHRMQQVNAAAAAALRLIADGANAGAGPMATGSANHAPGDADAPGDVADVAAEHEPRWSGASSDVPSFAVEALPAETFEALLLVAAELGEVVDDDPPYRLDTVLAAPLGGWCRLELLPDAGASTVALSIAPLDTGGTVPPIETVRDAWIDGLNGLDWGRDPT